MKIIVLCLFCTLFLAGCGDSSEVNFKSIKVFDNQFYVSLETSDREIIKKLNSLFNHKVEQKNLAPNFKFLLEFETSQGKERWRYSSDGLTMKYSQEDQRIFAVIDKDEFNALLSINQSID